MQSALSRPLCVSAFESSGILIMSGRSPLSLLCDSGLLTDHAKLPGEAVLWDVDQRYYSSYWPAGNGGLSAEEADRAFHAVRVSLVG